MKCFAILTFIHSICSWSSNSHVCPNEQLNLITNSNNISYLEYSNRKSLVDKITALPKEYLQGILDIVVKMEPELIEIGDSECDFDLEHMDAVTILELENYVKTINQEKNNRKRSDNSNLDKQLSEHTVEKPYDCPYCEKSFSSKLSKRAHIRNIHTHIKKFRCEWEGCGKLLANSANLTRHIRIHTGEKPFSCSFCGRKFNQSSNMKAHEYRIHKSKI